MLLPTVDFHSNLNAKYTRQCDGMVQCQLMEYAMSINSRFFSPDNKLLFYQSDSAIWIQIRLANPPIYTHEESGLDGLSLYHWNVCKRFSCDRVRVRIV
jgi:hypothetical protein